MIQVLFALFFVFPLSFGQEPYSLSPQRIAQKTVQDGLKALDISFTQKNKQSSYDVAQAIYDLEFTSKANYETSKAESFNSFSNEEDRTFQFGLGLKKNFGLGQTWEINFDRTSKASELNPFITNNSSLPDSKTLDIFSIQLTQNLLNNGFGKGNRWSIEKAKLDFNNASLEELELLEDLVVESLTLFWDTYVAKQNLEESLASRTRYEKLVKTVRRKANVGYANPGELSRVQAELEAQIQLVKKNSAKYLNSLDQLLRTIQVDYNESVQFEVGEILPQPEIGPQKDIELLRKIKIVKNKIHMQNLNKNIINSQNQAQLNLIGKASFTGGDEEPSEAFSEMTSATRPIYFVGLEFKYLFDSGKRRGEQKQAEALFQQANVQNTISRDEINNALRATTRAVSSEYQIAQSSLRTVELRKTALTQLEKAYRQGRSNILDVITAFNSLLHAQTEKTRAIGNYHIALNRIAAVNDLLVVGQEKQVEVKAK